MLPPYLALSYDAAKFTGPSPYEIQVAGEVAALPNLLTPPGYGTSVSGYLQDKINFRLSARSAVEIFNFGPAAPLYARCETVIFPREP